MKDIPARASAVIIGAGIVGASDCALSYWDQPADRVVTLGYFPPNRRNALMPSYALADYPATRLFLDRLHLAEEMPGWTGALLAGELPVPVELTQAANLLRQTLPVERWAAARFNFRAFTPAIPAMNSDTDAIQNTGLATKRTNPKAKSNMNGFR
jgi:hypothetical protein